MSNEKIRKISAIWLKKETKEKLAKFGIKGSTWDSVVNELMNHANYCDRFWSQKN